MSKMSNAICAGRGIAVRMDASGRRKGGFIKEAVAG